MYIYVCMYSSMFVNMHNVLRVSHNFFGPKYFSMCLSQLKLCVIFVI